MNGNPRKMFSDRAAQSEEAARVRGKRLESDDCVFQLTANIEEAGKEIMFPFTSRFRLLPRISIILHLIMLPDNEHSIMHFDYLASHGFSGIQQRLAKTAQAPRTNASGLSVRGAALALVGALTGEPREIVSIT